MILDRKVFLRVLIDFPITNDLSVSLMEEAKKQVNLHHEEILSLNSILIFNNHICLVSDYSDGEFLSEILVKYKRFSDKKALTIVKDISSVLHEAHKHGLIHGSLSPSDIIIDDHGKVKIINFNWREILIPLMKNDILPDFYLFRAPELFAEIKTPTIRCDIYSIGLILHQLLHGKLPYEKGKNLIELYENVKMPVILDDKEIAEDIKEIQRKLLSFSPDDRYNQPFNLINTLNGFLFMREELFAIDHKPVEIKRPEVTKDSIESIKDKPQKKVDSELSLKSETDKQENSVPVVQTDATPKPETVSTPVNQRDNKKVTVDVEKSPAKKAVVPDAAKTAELKDKYVELYNSYKRTITIAGLLFIMMVLFIVFFPDTIGGWLLGRF
jgi:serine/threonine protein kinase